MYKKKLYRQAIDCYLNLVSDQQSAHPFYREAALRNVGYAYYDLGEYQAAVGYLQSVKHAYDDAPDLKAALFRILEFCRGLWKLIRLGSMPKFLIISTTSSSKFAPRSKIR